MSGAQPSLLDLFEKQFSETFKPGSAAERAAPKSYQHYGAQLDLCAHCDDGTEKKVYWCHRCDRLGCWEWLLGHSD